MSCTNLPDSRSYVPLRLQAVPPSLKFYMVAELPPSHPLLSEFFMLQADGH